MRELTLVNCTFTASAIDRLKVTDFGKFEIDGGTWTFTATSGAVFSTGSYNCSRFYIKNATINSACSLYAETSGWDVDELVFKGNTYTQTALGGTLYVLFVYGSAPAKAILIKDNTVACIDSASDQNWIPFSIGVGALSVGNLKNVQIIGNAITTTQTGWVGQAIGISQSCKSGTISGNYISGFDGGIICMLTMF